MCASSALLPPSPPLTLRPAPHTCPHLFTPLQARFLSLLSTVRRSYSALLSPPAFDSPRAISWQAASPCECGCVKGWARKLLKGGGPELCGHRSPLQPFLCCWCSLVCPSLCTDDIVDWSGSSKLPCILSSASQYWPFDYPLICPSLCTDDTVDWSGSSSNVLAFTVGSPGKGVLAAFNPQPSSVAFSLPAAPEGCCAWRKVRRMDMCGEGVGLDGKCWGKKRICRGADGGR